MAVSCPQCQAAVVPGMRTCQFCGALMENVEPALPETPKAEPKAAEEPPVPPASAPSARAGPTNPETAPAKTGSGGGSTKLILYALPFVGVVLLFFAWRIVVAFSALTSGENSSSPQATGNSSPGFSGDTVHPGELGIDIYPGAQQSSGVDRNTTMGNSVVSASFVTPDKLSAVIDFYKARMVGFASIYAAAGGGVVVSVSRNPQDTVQVAISRGPNGGTTRISITHTTAP